MLLSIFSVAVYEWSARSCSQQAVNAVCDNEVNQSFLSVLLRGDLRAQRKEKTKRFTVFFFISKHDVMNPRGPQFDLLHFVFCF